MSRIFAVVLLFVVCLSSLCAAEPSSRVYADPEIGFTFRYPFAYIPKDQYTPALRKERQWMVPSLPGIYCFDLLLKDVPKDLLPSKAGDDKLADLAAYCAEQLPPTGDKMSEGQLRGLAGILQAQNDYTVERFDYYSEEYQGIPRPHSGKKFTPKEKVHAVLATNGDRSALIIEHDDRLIYLNIEGSLSEESVHGIVASAEIYNVKKGSYRVQTLKKKKIFHQEQEISISKAARLPEGSWIELETAHYHISGTLGAARMFQLSAYCEALYKSFESVYKPESMPPYKFEIQIFDSHNGLMRAAAGMGIAAPPTALGYFVPSFLLIHAYEEERMQMDVETVLAHECSHQFLHVACNGSSHVPTWVNEGLAVYFESGVFKGGKISIQKPRQRIDVLRRFYSQRKTLWPLGHYLEHYGHIPGENYGEVYALVHYWVFKNGEEGKKRFRKYFQALKAGENGTEAFDRIFMQDLIKGFGSKEAAVSRLEDELNHYVLKGL